MEKIWLKNYEKGIPAEINPDILQSLNELLEQSCARFALNNAFSNMGHAITYTQLEQQTRIFAAFLQGHLKITKGARIALMMPNILQYPIAMFGILRAGAVVVNVNPLYTPDELRHQLIDSGSECIIVLDSFAYTVEQALLASNTQLKYVVVTKIGDTFPKVKSWLINFVAKYIKKVVPDWNIPRAISYSKAMTIGKSLINQYANPNLQGNDIAYLQYTGGTTGISKGAILTHRNMIANLEQVGVWISSMIREGKDTIITALPMYHIFSLTANCLTFMRMGAVNVLITNPRDIDGFVKELSKCKFNILTGVNTLFNALLNDKEFETLDFSHLRISLGGGMAITEKVAEKWQLITKHPLLEAYGLTETAPAVCMNPINLSSYNGTIGLPIPSTEISIRDSNNKELAVNEIGELWVRGPQVMQGYWNKQEETANVLSQDGWLRTGDIAVINEDGFIRIVDRKKDMILVSGFNVYPNEVEAVISSLEEVLEVAVVGIANDVKGEQVKAFVVRKGDSLTKDYIIQYCRGRLTPYKVPKIIEFLDELPKSSVGKILRRALK